MGPGRVSRPTVVVRNQDQRPLDLVLEGVVKRPDGQTVQLDRQPLTLGIGEERQVQLPHYAFPNQGGVYRFDVVARFQGEVVARLPNLWQIELPQPAPATSTAP